MRARAESLISRVAAAARPARPWVHINASPQVARFLIAAGARPGRTKLPRAGLTTAELAYPNLREAILTSTDLHHADLAGADLRGADLRGADLRGADLRGADLRGAILTGAILTDAVLVEANLTGAYLRATNLRGAILTGADLAQVLWSSGTLWPTDMASLIRDRSEELRPGIWRVTGSGNAGAETEDRWCQWD
jgi:hypothetical protein